MTEFVSTNVNVDVKKTGSVIESPSFWRSSPAWTAIVEIFGDCFGLLVMAQVARKGSSERLPGRRLPPVLQQKNRSTKFRRLRHA